MVCKPRVLPHAYEKEVNAQVDELLKEGIVEISDSPYSSPIVPVIKKDGTLRICCDFRQLNAKTIPKSFPIPRTENLLEDFKDAEVFTVLDLKSAYWHIPVKESNKRKTAFVIPKGKFQWTVLPFGLCDAAFSLSYVMYQLLDEFNFAKSFYDDCIIFGKKTEHLDQIQQVLNKFAEQGIYVNLKKCQFMKDTVNFIGHHINSTGISPDRH